MNACASAAMLAAGLLLAAAAHAQPIELDGIELSRDVPCLGKDVAISGNANKISLTGDCGVVQVYGTDHEISLEKASALEVSGIGNSVTAKSVDRLTVDTNKNQIRTTILGRGQTAIVEVLGADTSWNWCSTARRRSLWLASTTACSGAGMSRRCRRLASVIR